MGDSTDPGTAVVTVARLAPDGVLQVLPMPADDLLPALYEAIGCRLVEAVRLSESLTMWLDEEGMYAAPAVVNVPATWIAGLFGLTHQPYFGVAVFTGGTDRDGRTLPLSAGDVGALRRLLGLSAAVAGSVEREAG